MVASDLGVAQAASFWEDMTDELFLSGQVEVRPSTKSYYDKVLQCLGLLMSSSTVKQFFRQMFVGRFRIKMN